ncbi:helix-turn-helix domain-containing protein [Aquibacillus kalidii]|uniref:helix-turn-helix domain-containing protein n=1 Tax=Aquibacillus kalidii TaxID=2762597 RepID=UPI0016451581|nr:helix-turn-helix domain-containing protein [Aquibacillus kalidii]
MYDIGKIIRQQRQARNLKQAELAAEICSVSYLSKIENKQITPSTLVVDSLCERLGISYLNETNDLDSYLSDQLTKWYEAMQYHDFEKVSSLYEELQEHFPNPHNYELDIRYKLFHFRYLLCMHELEQAKEAMLLLEDLKSIFEPVDEFYYMKFVGLYYLHIPKYREALNHLNVAEQLNSTLHIDDTELFLHLAIANSNLHIIYKSNYYAEKAKQGYQEHLLHKKVIESKIIIAINLLFQHEYHQAVTVLKKIIKNSTDLEQYPFFSYTVWHNLGNAYLKLDMFDDALHYLKKAWKTKSEQTDANNHSATVFLIAEVYKRIGNYELTKQYIDIGEKISTGLKYKYKFYMLRNCLYTGWNQSFIEKLEGEIMPYFEASGDQLEFTDCLQLLGTIYHDKQCYKKASYYFQLLSINLSKNTL